MTLVLSERTGDYAVVTLNRPEKRNAVSMEMAAELRQTLVDLEDCKVLVITGGVGNAFCAGIDLSQRDRRSGWAASLGVSGGQYWPETIEAIRRHPAVCIAAVDGYALGGGLTLVNNCELAVASPSAEFGMPELGFGSFPALAGPTTMKRLLPKHAAEMIFLSKRIDAVKALEWGLVNKVSDSGNVVADARLWAEHICSFDAIALGFTKRAVRDLAALPWTDAIDQGALVGALVKARRQLESTAVEDAGA